MTAHRIPMPLNAAPRVSDWISLSESGDITILSGRVELGQGNVTAICRMAADELGCAPEAIAVRAGQTGLTPNEGFTAGSMSVPMGGMAVRWAASAFRVLVLQAAAHRLGCGPERLELAGGVVLKDGQPCEWDLAALAGELDLDQAVADLARPFSPDEKRHGKNAAPRLDLKDRLVGTPFIHDLERPGMLFGKPVHPPTMTAKLKALDLDALKARPGVVTVVRDGSFIGIVAESEVDAIAAARWAKRQAEWTDTAAVPNDMMQIIAGADEPPDVVLRQGEPVPAEGRHFETTVTRPFLHHGSIGPSAAMAEWNDDSLTVWCHSQGVYQLRSALGMVFADVPEEKITVLHRPGAGCYGHNGADDVALDAALMARAVPGRPVRVVWSRADEFQAAPLGPGMVTRCEAIVDDAGKITGMRVTVNSAAHATRPTANGTPNLRAAAYLENPSPPAPSKDLPLARGGGADRNAVPVYAIPNLEISKRIVQPLPCRTSSLRSLGAYANVYAIETFMDEIARGIGADPIEFRLRHLDDFRAKAVIRAVAESVGALREETSGDGSGWGLGFARYKNTAGYCAVMARVEVAEEVRVTHVHAAADIGEAISSDGAVNQIEGGIIQSVSWTLKEAAKFEGNRIGAENWLDYPILRFSEVPEVSVILLDRPEQPPLGCGEIAQGPAAAAIGNAVRAALGVTVRDLPLTRDAVMRALQ